VHARGGAEVVLRDLLPALPRELFETQCVFPQEKGAMVEILQGKGIKTHTVLYKGYHFFKPSSLYKILSLYYNLHSTVDELCEIIKREKIDLVITNTLVMLDGALAAKKCEIPHIWYVHEMVSVDPGFAPFLTLSPYQLYSIMCMLSEKVVVVSEAVREEIEQYIGKTEKIRVVYNGVAIATETAPERKENGTVLSAGTMCRRKGFSDLLKAAALVRDQIPSAQFVLAGRTDKHYAPALWDEREQLKLRGNFTFLKFCSDMESLYREASMVVIPSLVEPFSLVALEGMRMGLPVIATRCGGPEEIVVDRETGFLVSKNEIAEKILWLFRNPKEATEMGRKGFERAKEKFSHEKFLQEFTKELF
jgi:glycosyltransferase involved in cell wall biosynthesis